MQTRSAPPSLEIVLHHRKDDTHEKVFFFVLGCTADFLLLDGGAGSLVVKTNIDAVSGAPLDNDIEIVYKEHFDDMVTHYADELTEAELLVSADVYDAIGMIRFDSEDSLAARQRIYGIASADDLHAILTGYFDPNDAAYTADTALDARRRFSRRAG